MKTDFMLLLTVPQEKKFSQIKFLVTYSVFNFEVFANQRKICKSLSFAENIRSVVRSLSNICSKIELLAEIING